MVLKFISADTTSRNSPVNRQKSYTNLLFGVFDNVPRSVEPTWSNHLLFWTGLLATVWSPTLCLRGLPLGMQSCTVRMALQEAMWSCLEPRRQTGEVGWSKIFCSPLRHSTVTAWIVHTELLQGHSGLVKVSPNTEFPLIVGLKLPHASAIQGMCKGALMLQKDTVNLVTAPCKGNPLSRAVVSHP